MAESREHRKRGLAAEQQAGAPLARAAVLDLSRGGVVIEAVDNLLMMAGGGRSNGHVGGRPARGITLLGFWRSNVSICVYFKALPRHSL